MEKKINLQKYINENNIITFECLDYILMNSPFHITETDKYVLLEIKNWKGLHVEIRLNVLEYMKGYDICYVDINNTIIDSTFMIENCVTYLENLINDMYKNYPQDKPSLPMKSDFKLDDDFILDKVGEEYVKEHDKWMKDEIKEHYIDISVKINYSLLTDNQKKSIVDMFTTLGFDESDIEIKEFNDTHNLWIRIKIY